MKARLIFHDKAIYPDGSIIEMTIWDLPEPISGSKHVLKYSLFYGVIGKRIIAYDNERGKGDHRHIGNSEEEYRFTTVEQLMMDFLNDVATERKKHERS